MRSDVLTSRAAKSLFDYKKKSPAITHRFFTHALVARVAGALVLGGQEASLGSSNTPFRVTDWLILLLFKEHSTLLPIYRYLVLLAWRIRDSALLPHIPAPFDRSMTCL